MITAAQVAAALRDMGVRRTDTLMVHSSVRACLRVAGRSPVEKMATLVDGLNQATVDGALVMPTFTYSFCNDEPFDAAATPSTVGALTDYFRQRPGVRRTTDPIFSTAIHGTLPAARERQLFAVGDVDCFGEQSVFSHLLEANAKLLFLGVGFEFCTFVHHIEQRLQVPYRYMKDFAGVVKDGDRHQAVTARYFVRELDGTVEPYLDPLGEALLEAGTAGAATLAGGPSLLLTDARSIESMAVTRVRANPDFLLTRGHAAPAVA